MQNTVTCKRTVSATTGKVTPLGKDEPNGRQCGQTGFTWQISRKSGRRFLVHTDSDGNGIPGLLHHCGNTREQDEADSATYAAEQSAKRAQSKAPKSESDKLRGWIANTDDADLLKLLQSKLEAALKAERDLATSAAKVAATAAKVAAKVKPTVAVKPTVEAIPIGSDPGKLEREVGLAAALVAVGYPQMVADVLVANASPLQIAQLIAGAAKS